LFKVNTNQGRAIGNANILEQGSKAANVQCWG